MQAAQQHKPAHKSARGWLSLPWSSVKTAKQPWYLPTALLCLIASLAFTLNPAGIAAQAGPPTPEYSSIVVFGDSLSDTGNVSHLMYDKYGFRLPGPVADYTDGSFTDGFDTAPPAQLYSGVWVKQLANTMPSKPEVKASLDGGTNYAYGFATTGSGTAPLSFNFPNGEMFVIDVTNIGGQISQYLTAKPNINPKTLFVVWGGANDFIQGGVSVETANTVAANQYANLQTLIDAGATQFIVPNLPPLGLIPRINGDPQTAFLVNLVIGYYNAVLDSEIQLLISKNPDKKLRIARLDVFGLFNNIVAGPANYSLTNVTGSSQGMPVNPDTYLFWDDLHPTTRGHNILAATAAKLLSRSYCMNATNMGNGPAGLGATVCSAVVQ